MCARWLAHLGRDGHDDLRAVGCVSAQDSAAGAALDGRSGNSRGDNGAIGGVRGVKRGSLSRAARVCAAALDGGSGDRGDDGLAVGCVGAVDGGKMRAAAAAVAGLRATSRLRGATGLRSAVAAAVATRYGNTSTLARLDAVIDNLGSILRAADGAGAVTEAVEEVGVAAQAFQVTLIAAELLGFAGSHHVVGTSLLEAAPVSNVRKRNDTR